jgi:hypothetical protein
MGLFTGLLTLPLAPIKGVIWIAEKIQQEAERELYDERKIRGQLTEVELAYETGAIDEDTYVRLEEELLDRLRIAREFHSPDGSVEERA